MFRYVRRDVIRNPRRTLASLVGVFLGVGLFSSVLFFIDGSGASMTQRALAPLALDMQVVLNSPLGGGITLDEAVAGPAVLGKGQVRRLVLTVRNHSGVDAHEVVVADHPPAGLAYVAGTTVLNGRSLHDVGGRIPLFQGIGGTGLNIGTVATGADVRISYSVRALRRLDDTHRLHYLGEISTRENVVPTRANIGPDPGLSRAAARIARIPGVATVDTLAFVDLPAGALRSGNRIVDRPVRLFGLDSRYAAHYPSIRLTSGSFQDGAVLSAEAAQHLGVSVGAHAQLRLPGRTRPVPLTVGGLVDLSEAKPLYYSRKSSDLEEFEYVPDSVVLTPAMFRDTVLPAFRAASAQQGHLLTSVPFLETDILVSRARLHTDPAAAAAQTEAIARAVNRIAPNQQYLIDNISNTLQVARDDAAVGKRMFLFLGLPGALLAAFLAAYTASVIALSQRREHANLRLRGAHRGHLLKIQLYRAVAIATVGSIVGAALGLVTVLAILGSDNLFAASAQSLAVTALLSVGFGFLTTALALYLPARRSLHREINVERSELGSARTPTWRRLRLDFVLIGATAVAEAIALAAGVFDQPAGSVYNGTAVSLPSYLLLAPAGVWVGGILLAARGVGAAAAHVPVTAPPQFGPLVRGTLARSLRRRSWTLAGGAVGVGLVLAFGTALALFTSTYDAAKAADARFTVGSDVRVAPSVVVAQPHPPSYGNQLRVAGVVGVSPVVYRIENSILINGLKEDRKNLAAIDPGSFQRVAAVSDRFFVGTRAGAAMAALQRDGHAVLVQQQSAEDLDVGVGDPVKILLARGTKRQTIENFRVAAIYRDFPGFPDGTDIVANLHTYQAAIKSDATDFFLVRTHDPGPRTLSAVTAALRSGPGSRERLNIDTTSTALNKDESSLTGVNVHGLVRMDSLYTLLMTAASVGVFVFGLMLSRRREYVALRARGLRTGGLQSLVLGEAALVAVCGLVAGGLVGAGMAYLMVRVLRPLFILAPHLTVSPAQLLLIGGLAMVAALVCALAATAILRRLKPTEILREN